MIFSAKKVLTKKKCDGIILNVANVICECAGIGRQARLRGVCLWRTGSSPVTRTISSVHNGFEL